MKKGIYILIFSILISFIIFGMIGFVNAANNTNSSHQGCSNLYWFDNNNSDCEQKEFCGAFSYYGLRTYSTKDQCEAVLKQIGRKTSNNTTTECKSLYWFDNDNKECEQKQFCGMYMYLGLQTFDSKTQCEKALNETKNNIEKPKNITFVPWQKRNESECPQGCKCHGAVVSCTTADGKIMIIEAGRSGNIITITVDGKEANTTLELETEADSNNKTKIKAVLSDWGKHEIKIMPDTASEKAIARLGELGFTIELKEKCLNHVGIAQIVTCNSIYELTGNKQGKFLGIFKIIAKVQAQVDAETGNVKVIKPWWSFLATRI